jgi:hypothetical protein
MPWGDQLPDVSATMTASFDEQPLSCSSPTVNPQYGGTADSTTADAASGAALEDDSGRGNGANLNGVKPERAVLSSNFTAMLSNSNELWQV